VALKQKALDKEVVKTKIRKLKAKEKDVRWVQDTLTQVEKTIQRSIEKENRASSIKYGMLLQLRLLWVNIPQQF